MSVVGRTSVVSTEHAQCWPHMQGVGRTHTVLAAHARCQQHTHGVGHTRCVGRTRMILATLPHCILTKGSMMYPLGVGVPPIHEKFLWSRIA